MTVVHTCPVPISDWAEMLLRMDSRWADRRCFKTELIEEYPGEEACIKSATIKVKGNDAYGWLKTERGVHRLVRISPYDAAARRHTSFAYVDPYPEIDQTIEIDVQDKDITVDTYRASDARGQHGTRPDRTVRTTPYPPGTAHPWQQTPTQH